jgi:hypothetical protein
MYGVSSNKRFLSKYLQKEKTKVKILNKKYNVIDITLNSVMSVVNEKPKNKYYISKIFLCKHINWIFIYIYIYSITNLRVKSFKKKLKLQYYNRNTLYQVYTLAKYKYMN